ncbi:MAG TPA: hypothetical protein DCM28_12460 [Phycisphaerales bacterium]|nr:hypothetical protein [Phycisphaerales bacterium]HCD33186.1 hypothetical protein [Phycisphaerales bacterium]|tara:strand:+ start:3856 stop:5031 length:1176 start_codon:yes stop_codon:yes gene_type:complete
MRSNLICTLLSVCLFAAPIFAEVVIVNPGDKVVIIKPKPQPPVVQSRIQIALLLDTSNSMDGLINQAKAQLWNIVNELSAARCGGVQPRLQVALYEYGNDRLSRGEGYIRQVLPFTTDLDKLSEELFKLTTNGGQEYCGMVINDALAGLEWSSSEADLKTIYIAGNEPFTQGPVDFRQSSKLAMAKNILVNPIFCGPRQTGIATSWQDGATLTGGCFLSIDQNRQVVYVKAPQDDEIARLNTQLNDTYIVYGGAKAMQSKMRQEAQDTNAMNMAPAVAAQRAVSKSSKNYNNSTWDLVDGLSAGTVKLGELKKDQLPKELADKPVEEIEKEVQKQSQKRTEIQKQIQELNSQRTKWLAEQASNGEKGDTLEVAILKSIRQQAMDKHYTFEK